MRYGLKEDKLAQLLIKAAGLNEDSTSAKAAKNWCVNQVVVCLCVPCQLQRCKPILPALWQVFFQSSTTCWLRLYLSWACRPLTLPLEDLPDDYVKAAYLGSCLSWGPTSD